MVALPVRELIERKLNQLDEEQLNSVLQYIEVIESPGEMIESDDDPLVGFISGPTDLAERSNEILHNEFGVKRRAQKP